MLQKGVNNNNYNNKIHNVIPTVGIYFKWEHHVNFIPFWNPAFGYNNGLIFLLMNKQRKQLFKFFIKFTHSKFCKSVSMFRFVFITKASNKIFRSNTCQKKVNLIMNSFYNGIIFIYFNNNFKTIKTLLYQT